MNFGLNRRPIRGIWRFQSALARWASWIRSRNR